MGTVLTCQLDSDLKETLAFQIVEHLYLNISCLSLSIHIASGNHFDYKDFMQMQWLSY